jgi:hypothetical protein
LPGSSLNLVTNAFALLLGIRSRGEEPRETCHCNWVETTLRAAGEHYVRIAELDESGRIADGVRACRTGRRNRMVGTLE